MSKQSDWDIALELAREQSLMDVDDLGAEQYRLRVLNERGACR